MICKKTICNLLRLHSGP